MNQKKTSNGSRKSVWLIMVAIIAIAGSVLFVWATVSRYGGLPPKEEDPRVSSARPGGPMGGMGGVRPNPGERRDGPPGRPSAEERQERFGRMMDNLNLTAEQREKVEALQDKPWQERRGAMREILTPEQQQQMRQTMRQGAGRRLERFRNVLSPNDFEDLQKRFERRQERRGRN